MMSRFSKNPFDDDDEGGFGSTSSRGGPINGYRGGVGQTSRGRAYEDDYGGGFGNSSSRSSGQGYGNSRGSSSGYYSGSGRGQGPSYQPTRGYYDEQDYRGGYGCDEAPPMTEKEFQQRKQAALQKMEDSSFSSLRTLHDCVRMGTETTEELERQAEALDRTEAKLDVIHVDLDKGQKHLNKIKSPFGGVRNYFAKKKSVNEVTDPKGFKPSQGDSKKSGNSSRGKQQTQAQASASQHMYKSTGSHVVDRNLDLMGKALDDLMGLGELIGEQLDDSDVQIERIRHKVDRDDIKMKKLNEGIKKELHK